MNKKILLSILLCTSVFLSGCSDKQSSATNSSNVAYTQDPPPKISEPINNIITPDELNKNPKTTNTELYNTTKEIYKYKNITIYYPQINNFNYDMKLKTINELIKNNALALVDDAYKDSLSAEINYKITLLNSKLLSIQYSGVATFENAAYPNNIFYTTNIDIKNSKVLKLSDFVKIDEDLVNICKKGKYTPYAETDDPTINKEFQISASNFITNLDTKDLLKQLKKSDSKEEKISLPLTASYLTENTIGVSINVPHVIGDHLEFEMKYSDLQNNISEILK